MSQNSNVSVTPGSLVGTLPLALWDTLRIYLLFPVDWIVFSLKLIGKLFIISWKVVAYPLGLLKRAYVYDSKLQKNPHMKETFFRDMSKGIWSVIRDFIRLIVKCVYVSWRCLLFLIYLLSFCSDRLEGLAGSLAPIADDTDDNVDEYADDSPAEEDEYVDPSDEEPEGEESYDEDDMDSDR